MSGHIVRGPVRAMERVAIAAVLGVLAVLALGCASGGGGSSTSIRGMTITAEDLANTHYRDAYEVLDQHRLVIFQGDAMLLRDRGPSSFQREQAMLLVIDGSPMGLSARPLLQGTPIEDIERIEILRASQAASRFGTQAGGGAVLITTSQG